MVGEAQACGGESNAATVGFDQLCAGFLRERGDLLRHR
jgi:hypothetical protein